MSTVTTAIPGPAPAPARTVAPFRASRLLAPFATLARRRLALSASTPRELVVPLLTPVLFAVIIAPALAKLAHHGSIAREQRLRIEEDLKAGRVPALVATSWPRPCPVH